MLKSLVSLKRPSSTSVAANQQRIKRISRNLFINKKYKVLLTKQAVAPFSAMFLIINKEDYGDFVVDVNFSSDSGTTTKDITSIKENELADVIGKYSLKRFRIRGDSTLAMDLTIEKNQKGYNENGDFVVDVNFSSDSGTTIKDITSIKENELADVIKQV